MEKEKRIIAWGEMGIYLTTLVLYYYTFYSILLSAIHWNIYSNNISAYILFISIIIHNIGLDYHYNKAPPPIQRDVFIQQLQKAIDLNKPIIIHTREAEEDTYDILSKYIPNKRHPIHIHCFTSSLKLAQQLMDRFDNVFFGFTGIITFKNGKDVRNVVKEVSI